MKTINKILCPVDFSDPSREAVQHAADLAKHFSARLFLFHAISETDYSPSQSYTLTPALIDQMIQITEHMKENAGNALNELIEDIIPPGISAEHHVDVGDPAKSIVLAAKEGGVDLIVMSTHGRSGIRGLFFGSVAEKVVRNAECPVLTMKPKSVEADK